VTVRAAGRATVDVAEVASGLADCVVTVDTFTQINTVAESRHVTAAGLVNLVLASRLSVLVDIVPGHYTSPFLLLHPDITGEIEGCK